jgi:Fe-S cluster assembly protein SufB
MELSTYFRINNEESGQFERTLIIAEERSSVVYLEGCTAPQFSSNQLHAAVVEIIALEDAVVKYSTVQNWYAGDKNGIGGVYNFVTKRGMCSGKNARISWTQVETGSSITWKYPSCVLAGENSLGEFFSVALTNNKQQADTGTKMLHLAPRTRSRIISKGISAGDSINTYRGLVKIGPKASKTYNYSQCDSLLIGKTSSANTFPYIEAQNSYTKIEHEASTSRIAEEQLFYLLQRGIETEEALSLMVTGFCKEVFNELPLEFASEADRLLSLKLEGCVG